MSKSQGKFDSSVHHPFNHQLGFLQCTCERVKAKLPLTKSIMLL